MKKVMIAAAAAAMIGGAFADSCTLDGGNCKAWDVKFTLKSINPAKAITCTDGEECDIETTKVYYMDNATRKIVGYFWACDYVCETGLNVALWDSKNQVAVWMYDDNGPIDIADVLVYGKKANKVAGNFEIENDYISLKAAGINGKFARDGNDDGCYIKSLSGYAAGTIAFINQQPTGKVVTKGTKGNLCEAGTAEVVTYCDVQDVRVLGFCDACCFETWCDDDVTTNPDLVPAVGTWSMKYNKKVTNGTKLMASYIPSYAL